MSSSRPRSTLFPYTTLFRSAAFDFGRRLARLHEYRAPAFGAVPPKWGGDWFFGPLEEVHQFPAGTDADAHWGDRKSTRLNSSHVAISYAVFCLKNKKRSI